MVLIRHTALKPLYLSWLMMKRVLAFMTLLTLMGQTTLSLAQQISKEELIFLTPDWKGERFPDGRPKVPDAILKRMKLVTQEEAWSVMKGENYRYQFTGDWQTINPDSVLVGRALTAHVSWPGADLTFTA